MRIIGGRLKGKPIQHPMGYVARPTTDFAREPCPMNSRRAVRGACIASR